MVNPTNTGHELSLKECACIGLIISANGAYFTTIKNLIHTTFEKSTRAALWVLAIAIALSLTEAYSIIMINANYSQPSYIRLYPLIFEYHAFAVLPLSIDWCWKENGPRRYIKMLAIVMLFTIFYLSVMAWIEWMISAESYSYWRGLLFTLTHSGPKILIIVVMILVALVVLKVPKSEEIVYADRLEIKDKTGSFLLDVGDIFCMETNDNYVTLYLEGGKSHLIRETISKLEKKLDPLLFQRIHRKFIINVSKVEAWKPDPAGGYQIILVGGYELKMSKSYKHKLPQLIARN